MKPIQRFLLINTLIFLSACGSGDLNVSGVATLPEDTTLAAGTKIMVRVIEFGGALDFEIYEATLLAGSERSIPFAIAVPTLDVSYQYTVTVTIDINSNGEIDEGDLAGAGGGTGEDLEAPLQMELKPVMVSLLN